MPVDVVVGETDVGASVTVGDPVSVVAADDELGVIVVRTDCVDGTTLEPLDTAVVCITRLVKGDVAGEETVGAEDCSSVVAIVVGTARVVCTTDDPIVVSGTVCTTSVVTADVRGAEVSCVDGRTGVRVVKIDWDKEMTDDPLVVRMGITITVVCADCAGVVSAVVDAMTSVRVRRVTVVSKVSTDEPLVKLE